MKSTLSKIVVLIILILILVGIYFVAKRPTQPVPPQENPPTTSIPDNSMGTTTSSSTQTFSGDHGISIQYPAGYTISSGNDGGFFKEGNLYRVTISVPSTYQVGTDFNIGRIDVLVSSSTEKCNESGQSDSVMTATKNINGKIFKYDPKQPFADDAMGGQRGMYSLYATIYNNQCYRIEKEIGYRDPRGFTDPPYPPHFDETKANNDLDTVISTLTIQ